MEDFFDSVSVGETTICVSPLSRRDYKAAGGKGLGGDFGIFVYEYSNDAPQQGISILAKAKCAESADKLFRLFTSTVSSAKSSLVGSIA